MSEESEMAWIAGFWRRIGALFIDILFLGALVYIVCLGVVFFTALQIWIVGTKSAPPQSTLSVLLPSAVAVVFAGAISGVVNYLGVRALHKDL